MSSWGSESGTRFCFKKIGRKAANCWGKSVFLLAKVRQAIIMFFRDGGFGFVRSEDEQFAGAEFENPEDDPRLPT